MSIAQQKQELFVDGKGTLRSLRSGKAVKHFEIRGKSHRDTKITVILDPLPENLATLDAFALKLGVKRIRWDDETFTDIEVIGSRQAISAYLDLSEAQGLIQ